MPALDKGLTDLVSDLERETDRCERGDDRAVSVHGSTRKEVAAFKDTETIVGLGPLFGEVHEFGQVGLSDADIVPCPMSHPRGRPVESAAAFQLGRRDLFPESVVDPAQDHLPTAQALRLLPPFGVLDLFPVMP